MEIYCMPVQEQQISDLSVKRSVVLATTENSAAAFANFRQDVGVLFYTYILLWRAVLEFGPQTDVHRWCHANAVDCV